ncbi:AFH_G0023390.mRNA.1.CDS.1 [Saccharomyces cerevisiae]|nr:AFH_G0023390.mRNA.1.CDS.1 [Saccharomyces cerevisiae]CAI6726899.1 AFH_G0023390.mRNA.1.CDS.1 [Saccharomyces cerevisiae]
MQILGKTLTDEEWSQNGYLTMTPSTAEVEKKVIAFPYSYPNKEELIAVSRREELEESLKAIGRVTTI